MDIEIDDEVFAALQQEAVPLVDNVNDVLRRLLGLTPADDKPVTQPPRSRGPAGSSAQSMAWTVKSRRAAGELLSLEAYCPHILRALIERGGELRSREMPDALAPLLEPHLLAADNGHDARGVPVWHGRVGWAGSLCRKAGHLDPTAPRGVWRITDKGREEAAQARGD